MLPAHTRQPCITEITSRTRILDVLFTFALAGKLQVADLPALQCPVAELVISHFFA